MTGIQYSFVVILFTLFLTSCKSPQVAVDGKTAYILKQYSLAPELLEKDYNAEKDASKKKLIANQIAQAYMAYNNTAQAAVWYRKALDIGDEDALYQLGKVQMMNEQYAEAIKSFTQYGTRDGNSKTLAQREIRNAQNALDWKQAFSKTHINNLSALNTPQSDFAPILYKGRLVFTSSRNEATGDQKNVWTGEKSADLFATDIAIMNPSSFSESLNSKDYEGTCTFNKEGNEIYRETY